MSAGRLSSIFSSRLVALVALGVAGAASSAGCSMQNALVDGSCADGHQLCGGVCVDVASEVGNCGVCGNVCLEQEVCIAGRCGVPAVSTPPGSDSGASASRNDSGTVGVTPGQGTPGDEGGSGDASDASTGDATTIGASDAGAPGTNDAGPTSPDASSTTPPDAAAAGDAAVLVCVPPLVRCDGVCTDVANDAFNCGVCGHFCPTYICEKGACVGSLPGEIVLVGHDYATSIPVATPQARVLVNTIFGSGSPTVRVLAYAQYAAEASVTSVDAILNGYADATHRQIAITFTSDPADVPSRLDTTSFDALLVLDEPGAPAGALGSIGASWATVVQAYASAGGTVVVLDGATAPEMPALVTNAGMFTLTSQSALAASTQVVNLASGSSVGSEVESPYLPTAHSAYFGVKMDAPGITPVIFDPKDGAPVVVQRVL